MDWKYLLSLTPEDLKDDEKDDLFDTVAWFECDTEEINLERCLAIFKVSQEILKYKKEQVETLLHELEEMAIRQGEEEARRLESDTDARSSRSRRSSSIEFENLEQKYTELRSKYKKTTKNCEKHKAELDKANNKIRSLEQENRRLQSEIECRPPGASSESDVSETIKDQHKEFVETIRNKNKQISDLLQDIEEVERENFVLRDKLSNVRDELSTATKEINSMTDILKAKETILEEREESYKDISTKYEDLQRKFDDLQEEKAKLRQEMEEFAAEVDARVEEWKKILQQKDTEIQDLKSRVKQTSVDSSSSSPPNEDLEKSQVNALQRALSDRDQKLLELQTQLQIATKEMEESTEVLKKLKFERAESGKRIEKLQCTVKELKKQLKSVHERCQNFQDDLVHAEKTAASKDAELKEILGKMKEDGQVDLVVKIEELQEVRADNRVKEKQIMNLVKVCNNLQDNCDLFEKENAILREKLGIPEDEQLTLRGYTSKQRKQKRELESAKDQIRKFEEERIDLKSEIHKLNGIISSLTNQVLEFGQKPKYDNIGAYPIGDLDLKKENKALVDENEALRKGLHEILNSVNVRKTSSLNEIKSETLEQLLRALDVKHISGWYHPAMRLQAELHNVEGINTELREQLRETRTELQKYKSIEEKSEAGSPRQEEKVSIDKPDSSVKQDEKEIMADDKDADATQEEAVNVTILMGDMEDKEISEQEVKRTLQDIFNEMQKKVKMIIDQEDAYKNIVEEHGIIQKRIVFLCTILLKRKTNLEETIKSLEDNLNIAQTKLKILEDNETDEEKTKKIEDVVLNNVTLTRKATYLEQECNKLSKKLDDVSDEFGRTESGLRKEVYELNSAKTILENNLKILKNLNEMSVDYDVHKQVKKDLDNMTLKYRELVRTTKEEGEAKVLEINMLQESQNSLERDKQELRSKLEETLSKLHLQNDRKVDENLMELSKKLAQCELNLLTEKQRANHTNNLYELVKEQLNKSEERFREYSKYNEDLLKKNLVFQEQLKQAEEQLCDYIDRDLYKQIQANNNDLLKQNEDLVMRISQLEEELSQAKENIENRQIWSKQQELLHLKHQIVDLIAVSDEKMIIAQLNSNLFHCRQSENLYRVKMEETLGKLQKMEEERKKLNDTYQKEKTEVTERENQFKKKLDVLQNLLSKQKQQYLGCVPLCCEEIYLETLRTTNKDKHEAFINLYKIKTLENEADILKEQLKVEIQIIKNQKKFLNDQEKDEFRNVSKWMQEKKALQINELRYKRQSEFKDAQIDHFKERVRIQDEQLDKLDEELLLWHNSFDLNIPSTEVQLEKPAKTPEVPSPTFTETKQAEVQTDEVESSETVPFVETDIGELQRVQTELVKTREKLEEKERVLGQLKSRIAELEAAVSLFRKQIGDKQSQIAFYERHILELQNKKEEVHNGGAGGDNINVGSETARTNEELLALKASNKALQDRLKAREEEIIKYQTLLKTDRDKHSLAAARLQEELQELQKALTEEKEKSLTMEETFAKARPNRAAIEQYMSQVHALERHTAELHTNITSLEAQLQSSRQEAVRWRSLANDRLAAMEELRNSLEEQHKNELSIYKTDSEKLKELGNDEVNRLRQLLSRHQCDYSGHLDVDIERLVKEKEERIHELTVKMRQLKAEMKRVPVGDKSDSESSPKATDLEASKELLLKEIELLRKRYDQLLSKERTAREEIRELKTQLLRKPSAGRIDRSEKSIKDQLQRKISSLENELADVKQSLAEQISINETHRVQATEDFEKWKKMKHWQQTAEKLKNKLKERDLELDKLQQTSAGYRLLIERLEREKHNLENRIKGLKSNPGFAASSKEVEMLRVENMKLLADVEALNSRLEMQQHHSGGLGAAMMQEKLESQERKIAVLELSSKGSLEIRSELERLQDTISALQKRNLCLEAENLDLKLDLEKSNKEVPRLHEQIQHLESYIDVLKNENNMKELGNASSLPIPSGGETKKVSELERTVFMLKRVVEKLQAENKRLVTSKRPISDRVLSADKVKRDYARLKEEHLGCIQNISQLEQALASARNNTKTIGTKSDDNKIVALSDELDCVREQLEQKSHLLDKVKVLLHRAASKEKTLLQEIQELRSQRDAGISPIQEESEDSSDI